MGRCSLHCWLRHRVKSLEHQQLSWTMRWPCEPKSHTKELYTSSEFLEHKREIRGFPGSSVVKNLPARAGDAVSIPGSGRSPGVGNGNPLQYSCLRNTTAEEPGWLQFRGSQRVRHDLATKQQLASSCLGYRSRETLISLHSSLSTAFQHLCSSLLRTLLASYSNIKDQLLWGTPWFYPGFPLSHSPPNPKYE